MSSPTLQRFLRNRAACIGAGLVALLGSIAMIGPWLVSHDPDVSDFAHGQAALGMPAGPSRYHWLGTDTLCRDILSRVVFGARISLSTALLATALAIAIGTLVGLVAGSTHDTRLRAIDELLMRVVDAGLSFPYLLLVMALGAALDRTDLTSMVIVLGATGWLGTSRVVRAKAIQLRQLDFVVAARALGQRPHVIMLRHVLPNLTGPLVVTTSASVATMILAESVLSYLQVGVQPPTATWGRMLRDGQGFFTADPRLVIVPAIAILLAVLGFNLLGEGLRDALDPQGS
ncbi:MAG: ABC transporter permease [Deltaproteobacteria bacterium]|nr:ABC transporter permease [Deltaproteobacteria bacterium]